MKIYPIVVCAASLVGCLLGGNDSEEGRPTQSDGNGKEASFSHPLCDQYLDCVREAAPQTYPEALRSLGPDAPCWQSESTADKCEDSCARSQQLLRDTLPDVPAACGEASAKDDAGHPSTKKDGGPSEATCSVVAQTAVFGSAACQSCLEARCCSELEACFDQSVSADEVDCDTYSECIDACASQPDEPDCYEACDAATSSAIVSAYNSIVSCAATSCSECGP